METKDRINANNIDQEEYKARKNGLSYGKYIAGEKIDYGESGYSVSKTEIVRKSEPKIEKKAAAYIR